MVQIEAYKDMIAPVVDAFKYLTQVCIDVCQRSCSLSVHAFEYFVVTSFSDGNAGNLFESQVFLEF